MGAEVTYNLPWFRGSFHLGDHAMYLDSAERQEIMAALEAYYRQQLLPATHQKIFRWQMSAVACLVAVAVGVFAYIYSVIDQLGQERALPDFAAHTAVSFVLAGVLFTGPFLLCCVVILVTIRQHLELQYQRAIASRARHTWYGLNEAEIARDDLMTLLAILRSLDDYDRDRRIGLITAAGQTALGRLDILHEIAAGENIALSAQ